MNIYYVSVTVFVKLWQLCECNEHNAL